MDSQRLIENAKISGFQSLETIKDTIKTFMWKSTYHDGFEEWSQRLNPSTGVEIHRIKVFKYIIEVYATEEPTTFDVSIHTNTVTIRTGGTLWNNYEACFDELCHYLSEADKSIQR